MDRRNHNKKIMQGLAILCWRQLPVRPPWIPSSVHLHQLPQAGVPGQTLPQLKGGIKKQAQGAR